jgi:uncharacterized membrane protein
MIGVNMISEIALKGYYFRTEEIQLKKIQLYSFVFLFTAGNIIFPYICHTIPNGGKILLPLFFFTLIASYKFGLKVGLLTAIISPLFNNLLFGNPPSAMLFDIISRSVLLAFIASYISKKTKKISLVLLTAVVLSYQLVGGLTKWMIDGSFQSSYASFLIGIPGMVLQVILGFAILITLKDYEFKNDR